MVHVVVVEVVEGRLGAVVHGVVEGVVVHGVVVVAGGATEAVVEWSPGRRRPSQVVVHIVVVTLGVLSPC